ncbi:hypothetical protein JCM10212_002276 [Sporobolomyces blumeae]
MRYPPMSWTSPSPPRSARPDKPPAAPTATDVESLVDKKSRGDADQDANDPPLPPPIDRTSPEPTTAQKRPPSLDLAKPSSSQDEPTTPTDASSSSAPIATTTPPTPPLTSIGAWAPGVAAPRALDEFGLERISPPFDFFDGDNEQHSSPDSTERSVAEQRPALPDETRTS